MTQTKTRAGKKKFIRAATRKRKFLTTKCVVLLQCLHIKCSRCATEKKTHTANNCKAEELIKPVCKIVSRIRLVEAFRNSCRHELSKLISPWCDNVDITVALIMTPTILLLRSFIHFFNITCFIIANQITNSDSIPSRIPTALSKKRMN